MENDLHAIRAINEDFNALNDVYYRIPKRYIRDMANPLEFYTNVEFKLRYRFEKNTVIDCIMPLIQWPHFINTRGLPLPPIISLLATLRFYSTSNFQIVCGDLRGISQPSICRTVSFVSRQIASNCRRFVKFPSGEQINLNRNMFFEIAQFPDVAGCIDCTHVRIRNPGGPLAEVFRNRKRYFSINVQVVCGPNLEMFDIVARWPGREHDSTIFNFSSVRTKFERGLIRGYLLGDSGYPCLPYLMTPLANPVTAPENRYNRSHIRTRNTVERLFGVWKRRFPCLSRGLQCKPEKCCTIIVACAVLYNIGKAANDNFLVNFNNNDLNEIHPIPNGQFQNGGLGFGIRRALIERHFQI